MLNSFAIKLLSALLVFALWSATLTLVLHQTVLNSHYVEAQLDSTHSYDRLSVALVDEIAHTPDLAAHPEVTAKITPILTPEVLKIKLNSALDQSEAYYLHGGPQPVIDLTDLAAQAQAAGIPLGQNSSLNKKIVLGGSVHEQDLAQVKTQNAGSKFDLARTTALIASVILVVALLGLSVVAHRYTALPTVLITVGVLVALLALFLSFAPGFIDHFVKFGKAPNAFAVLGHDLAGSIARDLGKRFGIIAAIFLAVGIASRIGASRLQTKAAPKPKLATAR